MARSVATVVEANFAKGLVTEATGLQFPESSVVETYDCVFDVLGAVQRRRGFDYEYGYSLAAINKSGCAINTYQWKNASGDGIVSFLVVQVGSTLRFYNSSEATLSLSANLFGSSINLLTYQAPGSEPMAQYECQFADGLGKLYVVHPCMNNIYITFDGASFTATEYDLEIRDFEGVDDGLATDTRPASLTDEHKYNLRNQGWDDTKINVFYAAASNTYPSNADVWWVYKNLSDVFDPATTLANNTRGNAPAPLGHYVLSVYAGDRSTASGGIPVPSTSAGAARTSVVTFFAGRVFYSGIAAKGFNSKIYFTQIIQKDKQIGQCYQKADPTNEDLFELLPDDGGVLSIPDAGTIYKLIPVQNNLLVFAYRGVWLISGSTGLGFTATDYVISRLSTTRNVSSTSYVEANGYPLFWNTDGIWAIQPTKDGSGLTVNPISRGTIQSFYDEIPTTSKLYARGYFNPLDQVVTWLYSNVEGSTPDEHYSFDSVLNLNMLTGAFYPWTISPGVAVHAVNVIDGTGGISQEQQIIDDLGDNVVDDAGNLVVGYEINNISVAPRTKFFVSIPSGVTYNMTFAENNDVAYTDWITPGRANDFESYFITGYKIHAQADRKFQSNYLNVYHEGIGTMYVQGVWDFSIATSTGRYSTKQLLRFEDPNYSNATKRVKIRGHGKALQYKVTSLGSNDFNVIGWSAWESQNSLP